MTKQYNPITREAAAVFDMWYGHRLAWRDVGLPPDMDMSISNPSYRDHEEVSYRACFPGDHKEDWREYVDTYRGGELLAQDRDEVLNEMKLL
jgi:hypothetical protein